MRLLASLTLALILLLGGCAKEPRSVPKRTAYPRIQTLPDSLVTHRLGNLLVQINASAIISCPKEGWMNVNYPQFGATLHLTATPYKTPQELNRTLDNRLQRISLNMGDSPARELKFNNDYGFQCRLLSAQSGTTPLQLLAIGPGEIVSGAVVFSGPTTPVDSIEPVISALDAELIAVLKNLRRAN